MPDIPSPHSPVLLDCGRAVVGDDRGGDAPHVRVSDDGLIDVVLPEDQGGTRARGAALAQGRSASASKRERAAGRDRDRQGDDRGPGAGGRRAARDRCSTRASTSRRARCWRACAPASSRRPSRPRRPPRADAADAGAGRPARRRRRMRQRRAACRPGQARRPAAERGSAPRTSRAAARAAASPSTTSLARYRAGDPCPARRSRASCQPRRGDAACLRRVPHDADAPAHRRAHGRELCSQPRRTSRPCSRPISRAVLAHRARHKAACASDRGSQLTLTAYLRRRLRGDEGPRRAGSERALEPTTRSSCTTTSTSASAPRSATGPDRAGDPRRGQPSISRASRRASANSIEQAREDKLTAADLQGRHLHDLQSRRERQPVRGADHHQPAAVGDPRRRQAREARRRRVEVGDATRS